MSTTTSEPGPGRGTRTYRSDDDHELETKAVAATLTRRGRGAEPPTLSDGRGSATILPPALTEMLGDAADALSRGMAVDVRRLPAVLTLPEAGRLLALPVAAVVALVDRGDLRAEQPGRHPLVRLEDVLAQRAGRRRARSRALGAMASEGEACGLYALPGDDAARAG